MGRAMAWSQEVSGLYLRASMESLLRNDHRISKSIEFLKSGYEFCDSGASVPSSDVSIQELGRMGLFTALNAFLLPAEQRVRKPT
jgi:hypothetical protein